MPIDETNPALDDPPGAAAEAAGEAAAAAVPAGMVDAREVFVELARQGARGVTVARLVGETHNRMIGVERTSETVASESRKTSEYSLQMVGLMQLREDREAKQAERDAKQVEREAEREAAAALAETEAAAAATLAETEAAGLRARTVGALVSWFTENWRMIAIVVAILLGLNVTPLLQAFGLAPAAAVAAPAPAASAVEVEAPTTPAPVESPP